MWPGMSAVPAQMGQGWAQSWCRCGRGERSSGEDVAGTRTNGAPMNALPVTRCGPAVWEVERSKLLGRRYYSTRTTLRYTISHRRQLGTQLTARKATAPPDGPEQPQQLEQTKGCHARPVRKRRPARTRVCARWCACERTCIRVCLHAMCACVRACVPVFLRVCVRFCVSVGVCAFACACVHPGLCMLVSVCMLVRVSVRSCPRVRAQ